MPREGSSDLVLARDMPPHPSLLVAAASSRSRAGYAHIPGACRFCEMRAALAQSAAALVLADLVQQRCCPKCAGSARPARSTRSAALPPVFGTPACEQSALHRVASSPVPMPVDLPPASPLPSLQ